MKKLAVIGTGIAGMSSAYFMRKDYDVTLFEKNSYPGGHTNTIEINDGVKDCPVDTGFMVFNETTYPNLLKLFKELNVSFYDTDMSFSVRNNAIDLEYNGSNMNGIFSQRKNIFNIKFIKMLLEIMKFNKQSMIDMDKTESKSISIHDYVKKLGLSKYFFDNFLVPMSSAVWSTPVEKMGLFPAYSLIRFFQNHGFVGVDTQLQWKTVERGSQQYKDKILSYFEDNQLKLSEGIHSVKRIGEKVIVKSDSGEYEFDKVIIASHADEALNMLDDATDEEKEILSSFSYQKNEAVVHSDETVMPKLKANWSSWNFMLRGKDVYTVYYMNKLQNVTNEMNVFININGANLIDESKIIKKITYHHPVFTVDSLKAQERIDELNTKSNIHFSGSYYRYGFHEDALLSSVNLCKALLQREVL